MVNNTYIVFKWPNTGKKSSRHIIYAGQNEETALETALENYDYNDHISELQVWENGEHTLTKKFFGQSGSDEPKIKTTNP